MLNPVVNSTSFVNIRNGDNSPFFVNEEKNPVITDSQTEDFFSSFKFLGFKSKRIFESQDFSRIFSTSRLGILRRNFSTSL